MATILHKEDDQQVVQLSAEYHPTWDTSVEIVTATFTENDAEISRITNSKKPKKLALTAAEAAEFAHSWLAFQDEQQEKKEAEETRKQEVLAQANKIVEEYPAIKIQGYEGSRGPNWKVTIPEINWNCNSYCNWAYSADELLEQVKNALEAYQKHHALAHQAGIQDNF